MVMDRDSCGKWRIPPSITRQAAGDFTGGMDYTETAAAVLKLTSGQVAFQVLHVDAAGLKSLVAAGHATGVSIDASVTVHTPFHTGTYTGGHTISVEKWRYNAALARDEYLVGDPGRGTPTNDTGYLWWPAYLLYEAAYARGGQGVIWLMLAQDTEGVSRKNPLAGSQVRATAATTGKQIGTLTKGNTYTVVSTRVGGGWTINGHAGKGWHRIKWGAVYGYVAGPLLV